MPYSRFITKSLAYSKKSSHFQQYELRHNIALFLNEISHIDKYHSGTTAGQPLPEAHKRHTSSRINDLFHNVHDLLLSLTNRWQGSYGYIIRKIFNYKQFNGRDTGWLPVCHLGWYVLMEYCVRLIDSDVFTSRQRTDLPEPRLSPFLN